MRDKGLHIFGIAGTAGAGKDAVADVVCRTYGAENLSLGDFVRSITRFVYRLPPDFNPVRDQLYDVATYLRTEVNPATTVKVCILQAHALNIKLALISGLRTMGEADAVRSSGGIIIGVDADSRIRYERIVSRQRDNETKKTYDEFLAHDDRENKGLSATGDLRGIRTIIDNADVAIHNNDSLEALEQQLRRKLGHYFTEQPIAEGA